MGFRLLGEPCDSKILINHYGKQGIFIKSSENNEGSLQYILLYVMVSVSFKYSVICIESIFQAIGCIYFIIFNFLKWINKKLDQETEMLEEITNDNSTQINQKPSCVTFKEANQSFSTGIPSESQQL